MLIEALPSYGEFGPVRIRLWAEAGSTMGRMLAVERFCAETQISPRGGGGGLICVKRMWARLL